MELYLTDNITKEVADKLSFQIKNTKEDEIIIHINSPGGNIVEGYNLFNAILNTKTKTTANISGLCASMALPIALACDYIKMSDFSLVMMHNPLNMSGGKMTDKDIEIIDKFKSSLLTIMHNRSGLDKDILSKMMSEETWLNSEDTEKLFGKQTVMVYTTKKSEVVNKLMMIMNKIKNIDMDIKKEDKEDKEIKEVVDAAEVIKEDEDNKVEDAAEVIKEDKDKEDEEVVNEEVIETNDEDLNKIIDALNEKITELEAELAEYKTEETVKEEENINAVLNSVKDRLTEEEMNKWFNIGKTDFGFMKSNIEKLSNINIINETKVGDVVKKENKTEVLLDLRKMEKEDPKKLQNIIATNLDLYKKSFLNTYGIEYTT